MVKLEKDELEKALAKKEEKVPTASREQEIAYHQGVLNTLVSERNELIKMVQNVEMIMQAHLKRLEELGVKVKKE